MKYFVVFMAGILLAGLMNYLGMKPSYSLHNGRAGLFLIEQSSGKVWIGRNNITGNVLRPNYWYEIQASGAKQPLK